MLRTTHYDDGDEVADHRINTEDCGTFRFDAATGTARCDACGDRLSENELAEIARR